MINENLDICRTNLPRYIVVEGPIGVGKTSLAKRLSESFNSDLILEQPGENPFLEQFYNNPRTAALPTQLFFLFQRARQIEQIQFDHERVSAASRLQCSSQHESSP